MSQPAEAPVAPADEASVLVVVTHAAIGSRRERVPASSTVADVAHCALEHLGLPVPASPADGSRVTLRLLIDGWEPAQAPRSGGGASSASASAALWQRRIGSLDVDEHGEAHVTAQAFCAPTGPRRPSVAVDGGDLRLLLLGGETAAASLGQRDDGVWSVRCSEWAWRVADQASVAAGADGTAADTPVKAGTAGNMVAFYRIEVSYKAADADADEDGDADAGEDDDEGTAVAGPSAPSGAAGGGVGAGDSWSRYHPAKSTFVVWHRHSAIRRLHERLAAQFKAASKGGQGAKLPSPPARSWTRASPSGDAFLRKRAEQIGDYVGAALNCVWDRGGAAKAGPALAAFLGAVPPTGTAPAASGSKGKGTGSAASTDVDGGHGVGQARPAGEDGDGKWRVKYDGDQLAAALGQMQMGVCGADGDGAVAEPTAAKAAAAAGDDGSWLAGLTSGHSLAAFAPRINSVASTAGGGGGGTLTQSAVKQLLGAVVFESDLIAMGMSRAQRDLLYASADASPPSASSSSPVGSLSALRTAVEDEEKAAAQAAQAAKAAAAKRAADAAAAGEAAAAAPATVIVSVQYCGGWGYEPRFDKLKAELEARLPWLLTQETKGKGKAKGQVGVRGVEDEDETGNFEVTATTTPAAGGKKSKPQLLFSKQKGQGFCDSKMKVDALVRKIEKLRVS